MLHQVLDGFFDGVDEAVDDVLFDLAGGDPFGGVGEVADGLGKIVERHVAFSDSEIFVSAQESFVSGAVGGNARDVVVGEQRVDGVERNVKGDGHEPVGIGGLDRGEEGAIMHPLLKVTLIVGHRPA